MKARRPATWMQIDEEVRPRRTYAVTIKDDMHCVKTLSLFKDNENWSKHQYHMDRQGKSDRFAEMVEDLWSTEASTYAGDLKHQMHMLYNLLQTFDGTFGGWRISVATVSGFPTHRMKMLDVHDTRFKGSAVVGLDRVNLPTLIEAAARCMCASNVKYGPAFMAAYMLLCSSAGHPLERVARVMGRHSLVYWGLPSTNEHLRVRFGVDQRVFP